MSREPGEDDDDETPAVDLLKLAEAEKERERRATEQNEEAMKR